MFRNQETLMKNGSNITLEVYDPAGPYELTEVHAPRLATLVGETVGELSNGGKWEQERTFPLVRELLRSRYPDIKIIPYTEFPEGTEEIQSDGVGEMLKKKGCRAVIIGNAARGECAVVAGRIAARIEKAGLPTMVITRRGFAGVVTNTFAGLGFSAEAPTIVEFPIKMFLPGSDLTPIRENLDKIIYGLTGWAPEIKQKGLIIPPKIAVEGQDYGEALDRMNHLLLKKLWGDGLPVLPATEERVNWILRGSDLPAEAAIGKILPRGRTATVKMIAINLAMAGGRPEYLPVLVAAVKAFVEPVFHHQSVQLTTGAIYPVLIVNGPVARQIRLNSGYGALGPDPRHPAGASIGRALRLIQMNLGGAIPGSGTLSIHGGASRYTNVVFAEDEDGLPPNWEPLNVSYWGYPRGTNTVTVFGASSSINVGGGGAQQTRAGALSVLHRFAGFLRAPNSNYFSGGSYRDGCPGIVLIARGTAQGFSSVLGLSKDQLKTFLWEDSKIPWSEMEKVGYGEYIRAEGLEKLGMTAGEATDPFPITRRPGHIMIVVAGGEQSLQSHFLGVGFGPAGPARAKIELPAGWGELLKRAEEDLGPGLTGDAANR